MGSGDYRDVDGARPLPATEQSLAAKSVVFYYLVLGALILPNPRFFLVFFTIVAFSVVGAFLPSLPFLFARYWA